MVYFVKEFDEHDEYLRATELLDKVEAIELATKIFKKSGFCVEVIEVQILESNDLNEHLVLEFLK